MARRSLPFPAPAPRRGVSIAELAASLVIVVVLLAVLVPAFSDARTRSQCDQCGNQLRRIGGVWSVYLADHEDEFPSLPTIAAPWRYGGARFSSISGQAFLDPARPLTPYLPSTGDGPALFDCPADRGIAGDVAGAGTGGRTCFRAYGTSFRANDRLFDARRAGIEPLDTMRGLRATELLNAPSRFVMMGEPIWFEVRESTGRNAEWHAEPDMGNLLFLDGSVRYQRIRPREEAGPHDFEPVIRLDPPTEASPIESIPRP